MRKQFKIPLILLVLLLLVNVLSYHLYTRVDFTSDGRFTISKVSENLIDSIKSPLSITVFLKGELNGEFKRLQRETQFLLEEFNAKNPQIRFEFINPVSDNDNTQEVGNAFYQKGMMPENLSVMTNGKLTKTLIFPWAVVKYKGQQRPVHLLNKKLNADVESMINSSVQNLEYAFTDVFLKLSRQREKKIAVLRSKGELEDRYLTDFLSHIREYYLIAPFSLDSVQSHPKKVLKELQKFDAIIEAKPTEAFTDNELYVVDQYIMNGGKALWMVESVTIEKDSLKQTGSNIAMPKDLNLLNLFFKYGVRINYQLINDVYSAPIYLTTGKANDTQLSPYPWFYEPLAKSSSSHPIVSNINAVKFEFANSLDTLKNEISKTVLLKSSEMSRAEDVPREINLNMINAKPSPEMYPKGNFPLAVLLEGEFTSLYKNRITPFDYSNSKDKSVSTKQIVISDGDIVKNEIAKGEVLSLGFDRFTGDTYGNKTFLTNALNYLLGDEDLVELRNKQINIPKLNSEKILNQSTLWQVLNIGLGIILIFGFGLFMFWYRQKRFR